MSCLFALAVLFMPRLLLFFILLLTDWFGRAYETMLWPILGYIFMPFATLAYMGAKLNAGALTGWWLVLFVIACLADLGSISIKLGSSDD